MEELKVDPKHRLQEQEVHGAGGAGGSSGKTPGPASGAGWYSKYWRWRWWFR